MRWIHVLAGIVWIGMLYFFNFVNGPLAAALDADTKRKVAPELMPRALFWFRWGAAFTWGTGVLLLGLVFHSYRELMFGPDLGWGPGAGTMVLLVFVAPFLYDALHKSPLGKDPKVFGAIAFALLAVVAVLMTRWAGFTWRAMNIHVATLFGTIMAWNVWFRIWPAQRQIIAAVRDGVAPDSSLVAMAAARSRHNTYQSVPLLFGMVNQHTTVLAGGNFGIPSDHAYVAVLAVVLVGWHVVWQLYKRAAKVKGLSAQA
jgi:uncharacterized membrane protein